MSQIIMIESPSNKIFKELQSLLQSSGIKKHKKFLVFGQKVIEELIAQKNPLLDSNYRFILSDKHYRSPDTLNSLGINNNDLLKTTGLKNSLFSELDIFNTKFPILELELPAIEKWQGQEPAPVPTLMSAMGDPNNLGAVLRCADGFGIKRVILLEESCSPYHPKSIRSSSGSFSRLKFLKGPSIHKIETPVVCLNMRGEDLASFSWPKNFYLLAGEEGPGVPESIQGTRLKIPMNPNVESLNAAVSMGIALFAYQNSLK